MTEFYVDTTAAPGGDGLSWGTAWDALRPNWAGLPAGDHIINCRGGVDEGAPLIPFPAAPTSITLRGDWSGFNIFEDCYRIRSTEFRCFSFGGAGKTLRFENIVVESALAAVPTNNATVVDCPSGATVEVINSAIVINADVDATPAFYGLWVLSGGTTKLYNSILAFGITPQTGKNTTRALRVTAGGVANIANCIFGSYEGVTTPVLGDATTTNIYNSVVHGNVSSIIAHNCVASAYTASTEIDSLVRTREEIAAYYVDLLNGDFTPADLDQGPGDLVDQGVDRSAEIGSSLDIRGNDRNDPKAGVAWDIGPYEWGFAAEPPTGGSNVIGGPFRTSGAGTEAPTYTTRTTQTYAQVSVDLSVGWVLADADGFAANRLPAGLSMSPQGLVTGTSQSVQSVTGIVVSNSGVNSNAFTWDVTLGAAIAPSYEARNITVNVPHSANLAAGWQNTDGSGFTIDALPTGLAMSSAGAVTGTPTVLDEVVASRVTHRGVSSAAFTWTVVGNQTVAPSYSDREVTVDVPVSVNLAVGWQNADPSGFTIDALPTGLSMNTIGLVTGTPTVRNETVASRVTNSGVASNAFTWDVAGKPVVVPTYTNRRVIVDVPYTVDLSIGWQNSDGSDFTIDALPTGLSMSTAGVVTGIPTVLDEVVTSIVTHMELSSNAFTWTVVTRPPSGTLADAKFDALRDQGFTGSISDMTLQWLQANGATSGSITDAWLEVLPGTGQRNDRWYKLLGDMGYTGSLNDREFAFWAAGGVLPAGAQDSGPANLEAFLISESWYVIRNGENFTILGTKLGSDTPCYWRFTWSEAEAGVYEQELPAPLRNDIDDSFGR